MAGDKREACVKFFCFRAFLGPTLFLWVGNLGDNDDGGFSSLLYTFLFTISMPNQVNTRGTQSDKSIFIFGFLEERVQFRFDFANTTGYYNDTNYEVGE